MTLDRYPQDWVKSSHSNGGGGGCIEWSPTTARTGTVPIRDSKDPAKGTLTVPAPAWTAFVHYARSESRS